MSPKCILLFSGKRKCGKDYLTDHLIGMIGEEKCEILKISQPIKSHWAKSQNLDLEKLLDNTEYKEKYRLEMIRWSEEMRANDYGCFCRIACANAKDKPIWIVSDIRRKSDLKWFKENYKNLTKSIRVVASDECRIARGWKFSPGVDDAESECDLDLISAWDFIIDNNSTHSSADKLLNDVISYIQPFCS